VIALDLDGTLLDYSPASGAPRVNPAAIDMLIARGVSRVAIVTNQGGLPFGVAGKRRKDGQPYPTPAQFCARLDAAHRALTRRGIHIIAVRVSCWHAYADPATIQLAARQVRDFGRGFGSDWTVYATERARKPAAFMLHSVGATEYWGDSPEDAQAAANAGISFVAVQRFV